MGDTSPKLDIMGNAHFITVNMSLSGSGYTVNQPAKSIVHDSQEYKHCYKNDCPCDS